MKRFGVAALVAGLLVLATSCGTTDEGGETQGIAGARRDPFTAQPGYLEGTYLKVLWTYHHNKDLAGLYYAQGIILLVTTDNDVVKLDPTTGLPLEHRLRLKGKLECAPAVYRYGVEDTENVRDEIFFVQEGDMLWCVEAETLLELWAEDLNYGVSCSPCVSKEMVFVPAEGGRVNALRKDSRTVEWSYAAARTVSAPPVLAREAQVVVDSGSGDEAGAGGEVRTVVRDADFLYVASEDGNVYRLNVYTGWKPPGGSGGYSWAGQTRARIVTSPVAYQQRVFAASFDFSLYAFESVDGAVAWKYHVGRFVREQPFACRETIFLIAEEEEGGPRTMYAVNSRNGSCRWRRNVVGAGGRTYEEDGLPGVGKLLAPGRELVYVLAQEKPEIWGVRIADGQVVHRVPLTDSPDFVVSHDAEHGREVNDVGLILMATADGRILALKERRVYTK